MTENPGFGTFCIHHRTKMQPLLDAERNTADTSLNRMTLTASRQPPTQAAIQAHSSGALAVTLASVGAGSVGLLVSSSVGLLPALALLIGLGGLILLPEVTKVRAAR